MSKRILLIDSDETFARSLQSALEGRGLSVQMSTNSEQGMAIAKSEQPELIVVCVEAQPTNGYMLCTRLKKDDQLKMVPVVLTSANATPDSFEKHKKLKTRAEEYLIKPFEPEALLHRIGTLLRIEIPPPAHELEGEQIVSMEDEPLGLGDLVGEDEPVHLTDSEAAEARGNPPGEVDTVDVEEVISEAPEQGGEAPAEQHSASDEDLDMLDAAFDALSPASRPPPSSSREPAVTTPISHEDAPFDTGAGLESEPGLHSHEETQTGSRFADTRYDDSLESVQQQESHAHEQVEQVEQLQDEPMRELIPEVTGPIRSQAHMLLEKRVHELEAELAARDAELDAAKKVQTPNAAADLRKLKEQRTKGDKEILGLKEELNAKEKELIELRDQQATLEHQAHTLEDEASKREIAAKALQQRAEALAAAAKKFERELSAAREELKTSTALKARIAELEKGDAAYQALQKTHATLQTEVQTQASELQQHKERLQRVTAELSDLRLQHENELGQTREQHQSETAELQSQIESHQDAVARAGEEKAAVEGQLSLARDAHEKTQAALSLSRETTTNLNRDIAATRAAAEKVAADLETSQLAGLKFEDEIAALKAAGEKLQDDLALVQIQADKHLAEASHAREELEKLQLELTGAQEQYETAKAELSAAMGEKHLLSDERDELRQKLDEAQTSSARNEARAVQAYARIKGDEKLREKTKKALQIALQLLDEVPSLPDDGKEHEGAPLGEQPQ